MKRTHEMPLVAGMAAGMAVGLAGVALGILLARREGHALRQRVQQAKRPFVSSKVQPSAGGPRQDSDLHMQHLAQQVRQASEQMVKVASAQYEQYLPKAKEALSGALASVGLNGKPAGSAD